MKTQSVDEFKARVIAENKAREEAELKAKAPPPSDPKVSEISIDDLLGKSLLILYRETKALLMESSGYVKLSKESAQCLRDNLKLLLELKDRERDLLENLSHEELEAIANKSE